MPSMPFSQNISSIVQGISRQAPGVRFPGQVENARNITFNIIDGARKRQGSVWKSTSKSNTLTASPANTYSMHRIERDDQEEYLIVYGKGLFAVYDSINNKWYKEGDGITFVDADAKTYLAHGSPKSNELEFVTIADTTFIANVKRTTRTLSEGSSLDATRMPVMLQRTSLGPTQFQIKLAPWKERSYHTQVLSFPSDPGSGTFRLKYEGDSSSRRYDPGGATINLAYDCESDTISEYLNGNGVDIINATDKNEAITGLDTIAYGKVIVTGGPIHKKPIKLQFSPDLKVDELVQCVSNTTGQTMDISRGDEDDDPAPLIFKDNMKITNLSYHRNRLVMTADELVVFSATDDVFMFYMETPGTLVDSDPIVSQLAATDVCIIDSIIPFRNALILLTKAGQQFELGSSDVFSPSTASVTPSTRYNTQSVKPTQIGDRLYLVGNAQSYTPILEYFYSDAAVSNKAADITKHVDDLIPPVVITCEAAPTQDCVLVMPTLEGDTTGTEILSNNAAGLWSSATSWVGDSAPTEDDNVNIIGASAVIDFDDYPAPPSSLVLSANTGVAGKLFIYRSYTIGEERKQSAWTIWDFGADALMDIKTIDDELFILRRYTEPGGNTYLAIDTIDMSESPNGLVGSSSTRYEPHLDHRQGLFLGVHSDGETTWTITNPDPFVNYAVLTDGATVGVSAVGDTGLTFKATGNHTGYLAYLGRSVDSELELSEVFNRTKDGKPMLDGRTTLNKLIVTHRDAGDYTIETESTQTLSSGTVPTRVETFTSGTNAVEPRGVTKSWVQGQSGEVSIKLKSTNPKPCTWIALEYHGNYEQLTHGGGK